MYFTIFSPFINNNEGSLEHQARQVEIGNDPEDTKSECNNTSGTVDSLKVQVTDQTLNFSWALNIKKTKEIPNYKNNDFFMVNYIRTTGINSITVFHQNICGLRKKQINVSKFSTYLVFLWTLLILIRSTFMHIILKIVYVYIATYDELEINFIKCLNYTTKSIKNHIKIASGGTLYVTLLLYAIICIFSLLLLSWPFLHTCLLIRSIS